MLKYLMNNSKSNDDQSFNSVVQGLKQFYVKKLLPLEKNYKFHDFHSPPLEEADFDAKPMIILIGQYSTGKTTFIRYLLEDDFPGIRIGPEPTTDGFIAIMHGETRNSIPGNALVVDPQRQFRPLAKFGNEFLNRLQCSVMPNSVLQSITIIDTPGILSGEKQRVDRGYEFTQVIEWFAERVDRIVLLFDAHKLDISDEFKRTIEVLKGYEDKIRIVLNKADMIDSQQLMRIYGALMWSLGKVLHTPEVARVFIGSFWDRPLAFDYNRKLFELEASDLFHDLQTLPSNMALRKLNDLIRRARLAKVHALIISHLKTEMPSIMGKDSRKKELIRDLPKVFEQLARENQMSLGDFPSVTKMRHVLAMQDFKTFSPIKPKMIEAVDDMLSKDIPRLMTLLPNEQRTIQIEKPVVGGAFVNHVDNPFGFQSNDGINRGRFNGDWIVNTNRTKYDKIFSECGPLNGKLSGAASKSYMLKSKLPNSVLSRVWKLSDVDEDGFLDADEFALACYLIDVKLDGDELPNILPEHLIPPSKRFDDIDEL